MLLIRSYRTRDNYHYGAIDQAVSPLSGERCRRLNRPVELRHDYYDPRS